MAKYLKGYRYDVFLSYAHVDDEVGGEPPGWVTSFKKYIEKRLAQLLGRRDAFNFFMDHDLKYSEGLTPQLMTILEDTAVLLVILSPGYAASEWCKRERNKFLESAAKRSSTRIIIVERDRCEDLDNPGHEIIADHKRFAFWREDSTGRPRIIGNAASSRETELWYDRIDDVSREIASALRALKKEGKKSQIDTPAAPADSARGKVFVAHVTDDLESTRDDLMRRLEEEGIEILPHGHYALNREIFQQCAERDMAQCETFVQLLSGLHGRKPPDVPEGFCKLQADLAAKAGLTILQWRPVDLVLADVRDAAHRDLLTAPTVRAQALESFKQKVIQCAKPKKTESIVSKGNRNVFVCTEPSDLMLADELSMQLDQLGVECLRPTSSKDPGEYRVDLYKKLKECDGLILAYEYAPVSWVNGQLNLRARVLAQRTQIPTAVFAAAPQSQDGLPAISQDIQYFERKSFEDTDALKEFVDGLPQ